VKPRYTLLSPWQKVLAWIIVLTIGIESAIILNINFLQAKMLGQWRVVSSDITYKAATFKTVSVTSQEIIIGSQTIKLTYSARLRDSNFLRENHQNEVDYYFDSKDNQDEYYPYLLVVPKSKNDRMTLFTFQPSQKNTPSVNTYTLRQEHDR